MPEKLLYEYAIIRIVPRVERSEFINAGVILYCREAAFLDMKYEVNESRIFSLYPKADIEKVRVLLEAFRSVCCGHSHSGPIGLKIPAERFRWLTAKRSTIIQTSEVHPGLCDDPEAELKELYTSFVQAEV